MRKYSSAENISRRKENHNCGNENISRRNENINRRNKNINRRNKNINRRNEKHSCRREKHGRRRGTLSSIIIKSISDYRSQRSQCRGVYAWQIAPIFKWG